MKRNVEKTNNGISIKFQGVVQKQNIVKMVENCASGKCDCMSDDTKAKIENMSVNGEDGNVSLNLDGQVTKQEIEDALSKSKLI